MDITVKDMHGSRVVAAGINGEWAVITAANAHGRVRTQPHESVTLVVPGPCLEQGRLLRALRKGPVVRV